MITSKRLAAVGLAAALHILLTSNVVTAQQPRDSAKAAAAIARARRSVVALDVQAADGPRTGSGIILSADGMIATAAHVVDGATSVLVRTLAGDTLRCGGWLYLDPHLDFALIKVQATDLTTPMMRPEFVKAPAGSRVRLIAWPPGAEQSVTERTLSRRWWAAEALSLIELDVPFSPAVAGGAVVTAEGWLVGLVTAAGESGVHDVTLAYPIGMAVSALSVGADRRPREWNGERSSRDPIPPPVVDNNWGRRRPVEFGIIATGRPAATIRPRKALRDSGTVLGAADLPDSVNRTLSFDWEALDGVELYYEEGTRGDLPTIQHDNLVVRWKVLRDSSGVRSLTSELSLKTSAATWLFGRARIVREYLRTAAMPLPGPGSFTVEIRDRELDTLKVIDSATAVVRRLTVTDSIAELWVDDSLADRIRVPRGVILDTDEGMALAALRDPIPDRFDLWLLHVEGDTLAVERAMFRQVSPALTRGFADTGFGYLVPRLNEEWKISRAGSSCQRMKTVKTEVRASLLERAPGGIGRGHSVSAATPHVGGAYLKCVKVNWRP